MTRFFAALALCGFGQGAYGACAEDRVDLRGMWGTASFSITLADDPQERARGLMFVEEMPMMTGMLFVYERPQPVSFWMRNTLIPLDMIFIDRDGSVGHIHHNAIPGDETGISGQGERYAVLEINGGLAKRLRMTADTVVRHPAFGPDAAWACDATD